MLRSGRWPRIRLTPYSSVGFPKRRTARELQRQSDNVIVTLVGLRQGSLFPVRDYGS